MPTFSNCRNSLVCWLTFGIVAGWVADTAEAQSFSRALKQVIEQLSKSSDEPVKAIGEAASHLTRRGDDVAERLGQELGGGGSALSTPQALRELQRLGVSDATGNLGRMLNDLPPVNRRGLIEVLEQSKRALDVGARKGIGLWEGEVELKSYCMGKVMLTDPYSLLDVGLPGALETVPYNQFDYAKDSTFSALKVGLTIDGLNLPPLPP